jgi:NAD-dependent dihydropyrimidine dehydrogenase PreA subunit
MVEIIIDREKCVGCEDCLFICPVSVFKIDRKKALPVDSKSCCGTTCGICVEYCWRDAIIVN